MTNELVLSALIAKMRYARKNSQNFESKEMHESAEMWRDAYATLESVLYSLIETRDDEWVKLIKELKGEW